MIELWKVCQDVGEGRFASAWSPHMLNLEYGVGLLTEPHDGTGLFAFEDPRFARAFQEQMLGYSTNYALPTNYVLLRGYGEPGPPLPGSNYVRPEIVGVAQVLWGYPEPIFSNI